MNTTLPMDWPSNDNEQSKTKADEACRSESEDSVRMPDGNLAVCTDQKDQDVPFRPRTRPRNSARAFKENYSSLTPANGTRPKKRKLSSASRLVDNVTATGFTPTNFEISPPLAASAQGDEPVPKRHLSPQTTPPDFSSEPQAKGQLAAFISDTFNSAVNSFVDTTKARIAHYDTQIENTVSETTKLKRQLEDERTKLANAEANYQLIKAQHEEELAALKSEAETKDHRIDELERQVTINQHQFDDKNKEV